MELKIRLIDMAAIHDTIGFSMDCEIETAGDEEFSDILEKYKRFGNLDNFIYDQEAIGYVSCTQHNLLLNSKCLIYKFDDIENLRSWLDMVETYMSKDGIDIAKLIGHDPESIIKRLRDFCDGVEYYDEEIKQYYDAIKF